MNEKRLDENTVRYCLYPALQEDNDSADRHRTYIDDCLAKLANHLTEFYWHYTPFNLRYVSKEASHSKSGLPCDRWRLMTTANEQCG